MKYPKSFCKHLDFNFLYNIKHITTNTLPMAFCDADFYRRINIRREVVTIDRSLISVQEVFP